jgi:adenosine/AMP kinase
VVAESKLEGGIGRGILGVIDGFIPKGIENNEDFSWRK